MSIVGNNSIINQFVPTMFVKDLLDGQTLRYDSTRRAFVNAAITAGPTAPEVVVWHYSSGAAGDFAPSDVLFSQTFGVTASVVDGPNCIAAYAFTGKANPPKSITFYGQDFTLNTFAISTLPGPNAPPTSIRIAGGGTAAFPDLANSIFSAANVVTLQTTMANVGALSTIGNRAWCIVVFGF